MTVYSRHIDNQNQIILPSRHYEMLSITVCRFPFSRGPGSSVRKKPNKVVNSAKRAERGTKKWERATCSGRAFPLPLLSPPRSLPLSSPSLGVILFLSHPPPPGEPGLRLLRSPLLSPLQRPPSLYDLVWFHGK